MNNNKVQERLLREEDQDLGKAILIVKAAEEVKEQLKKSAMDPPSKLPCKLIK